MSNNPYQIPSKRRELKDNQEFTRHDGTPWYSLDNVHVFDWKLFIWFASIGKVENYIYLFIVIWDAIDDRDCLEEFEEEVNNIIKIIEDLRANGIDYSPCSRTLNNYKNYRSKREKGDFRQSLINNAWVELEGCGLKPYSHAVEDQLGRCTYTQKKYLRKMVISRMKSFQTFERKRKESRNNNNAISKENEILKNQINTLKQENLQQEELLRENERLKAQIADLMKENSKHQAALGNLRNVSWNDDDPNNTRKLIDDITELQDMISDFTMVQGCDYKIVDEAAAVLLRVWKCKVEYPSTTALVLGVLLQQFVIKKILETANKYFNGSLENKTLEGEIVDITLEKEIVNTTKNLIYYTDLFKDKRKGSDDITNITPVKIRQHVYSSLGHRGLSEEHCLIKETAKELLDEMNKFREVVDEETKDGLYDQAIQITHKVINIFCFRLKTHASEPTYQFFEVGQDIDVSLMQGAFGRDEGKKLEVEACGFPLVGILNGNKSNQKAFTKAQVIARPKELKQ